MRLILYTVHLPGRARDLSGAQFIRSGAAWYERLVALILPFVWLIWRRNWAILVLYLLLMIPMNAGQVYGYIEARWGAADAPGGIQTEGYVHEVTSLAEVTDEYQAIKMLITLCFMFVCAVFPGDVTRFDRDLRRFRNVGFVSATDRVAARDRWRPEGEAILAEMEETRA